MTPKILFNYPNKLQENELKFNIKFLKNFCFNEGVKVKKYYISDQKDYEQEILEKNFFSKSILSFCLLQQVTTEDVEKYFIFGIKFDDFYITESKICNRDKTSDKIPSPAPTTKNIFVYEKTYLFIANEPMCKLFESIFQHMLNIKKLNFYKNLDNYEALFLNENIIAFERENNEKVSNIKY
jgi:hypothetical protein